jgi:plastocyanin
MRPRRLLPAALALALVLLAGCGTEKSAGPKDAGGSVNDPATASGGKTVKVAMRDILFVPDKVTARVGQTVRWTNEDDIDHTVKAQKGADFASKGPLSKGDSYSVKLTEAGTIGYVCTIHPSQRGTITVVK